MFDLRDLVFTHKITSLISVSPLCLQDDQALYQHICRERRRLLVWCPWIDGLNHLQDVQSFLSNYQQQLVKNEYFRLGLYDQNHLIGWVAAFNFNWSKGEYELGYWIASLYQRKGYTLYSAKFMISLLSSLFSLKTFYILCKEKNQLSRRMARLLQARRLTDQRESIFCLYKGRCEVNN